MVVQASGEHLVSADLDAIDPVGDSSCSPWDSAGRTVIHTDSLPAVAVHLEDFARGVLCCYGLDLGQQRPTLGIRREPVENRR